MNTCSSERKNKNLFENYIARRILKTQQKTLRKAQKALRTYKLWKECGTKAFYFKKEEVEDFIFHLGIIFETTEKGKAAQIAYKLRKYFIKILEYEFKETPRKIITEKLVKERKSWSYLIEAKELR